MSARRRSPNKEAADQAPKGARFEYWLKVVPLVTGAVSGILALIPQTSIFGPFDYTAETLLIICVIGIMVFAVALVRTRPKAKSAVRSPLVSSRLIGAVLMISAPLLAWWLWYAVLRLPPEKEEAVRKEIALGDTELQILGNPAGAREHYRNALLLAPRRGSIRTKIQDAEERMRLKGD